MFLEALGASAELWRAFNLCAPQGLVLARIARAHRDHYQILTETGEIQAEASGSLLYRADSPSAMPVVGDWVSARIVGPEQALIENVLPRRTFFSRRAAGRRNDEQAVAANIDLVFLVCGLDGDFNLRRLERYLTLAAASGALPVVLLNKSDLCPDVTARVSQTAAVAVSAPVIAISAQTGVGLESVRDLLAPGRTAAVLGSSGAGKSTLINRLLGENHLRTAEVRAADSRGRHTTTHRELVPIPGGGALIDTPGMRELQLWADPESVETVFQDIAGMALDCRFRDCSHSGEVGCAVEAAALSGTLSPERLKSYRKLIREAQRHQEETDALTARERKQKTKRIHRAMRRHYKFNQ